MPPTPPNPFSKLDQAINRALNQPTPQDPPLINVGIKISGLVVEAKVRVSRGPVSLRQFLPIAREFNRAIIKSTIDNATNAGVSVSCRLHCTHCCHQLVPVAPAEAHAIAHLVATLPEPRRTEVLEGMNQAKQKLADAGLLDQLDGYIPRLGKDFDDLSTAYYHEHIPCPFLKDEACSIYDDRPITCREYLATTDPIYCKTLDPQQKTLRVPGALFQSLATITDTAREMPPLNLIPLVLAPDWAAVHPEPSPTTTGPQLLNKFLAILTSSPEKNVPPA